jgi:hypothetical protein
MQQAAHGAAGLAHWPATRECTACSSAPGYVADVLANLLSEVVQ